MPSKLEYPGEGGATDAGVLYLAKGDEVSPNRPLFTGDTYTFPEGLFLVLQHPCALRVDGVTLVDELLAAQIVPFTKEMGKGAWRGNYRLMLLPQLDPTSPSLTFAASFTNLKLIASSLLLNATRTACLSQIGINLLLQRWVHHNSRVVVPTFQYQEVTSGPLEECDLTEEWADESLEDSLTSSWAAAHEWFRGDGEEGRSRQDLLVDPQNRASVRRAMREHLRGRSL